MIYTLENLNQKIKIEATLDIDWYCIDNYGHIAVVASGGGMLPYSITEKLHGNDVINYFRSLPVITNEVILQENVIERIKLMKIDEQNNYLRDVNLMVSKGLFYFDKSSLGDYYDFQYYLKARPKRPLKVDEIDVNIKNLISNTIINCNFEYDDIFYVNSID